MSKIQSAAQAALPAEFKVIEPESEVQAEPSAEKVPLRQLGGTYFYSSGIINKKNVFVTPEYMDLLVNAFKMAEVKKDVKNLAYVVMPNHFCWIFRLSEKQDDPVAIYKDVKKDVAFAVIKNLLEEAKEGNQPFELLDIFQANEKVGRSNPRKILWTFKEEAKNFENNKRYRVWDKKSRLMLLDDEKKIIRNLKFIADAPLRDRWQFVETAQDYPYLYIAEDVQDKLVA